MRARAMPLSQIFKKNRIQLYAVYDGHILDAKTVVYFSTKIKTKRLERIYYAGSNQETPGVTILISYKEN